MSKARHIRGQSFASSWNSYKLNVILNSILTIAKKENIKKFSFDCYNTLISRIAIVEFFVNLINDLIFTINLYFFLLYNIFKNEYEGFFFEFFWCNLDLVSMKI